MPVQAVLTMLSDITGDISLLSSLAVIIGALFVAVQLTQNNRLIRVAANQAQAAVVQAKLSTEQLKQNNEIADMDIIMRLYEFANSSDFQSSWLAVLNSGISSFKDFERLPDSTKVAFYQVAALFESLGVLVERKMVSLKTVDDMFLTELAWNRMKPFVAGTREMFGEQFSYAFFEQLYNQLATAGHTQGA